MSRDFDVVVIGAGVVGTVMASLSIALQVSRPGRVALVADRAPDMVAGADWDLRVFAMSRASQRVLQAAGAWAGIPVSRRHAYERMCVWDARGEPGGADALTFDCAWIGEPDLGHIVEGHALQVHCARAALAAGAVFIEGAVHELVDEEDGVRIRLQDGRELSARLLIAADGPESKVRGLLGIETSGHSYQQDALVAHVRTERDHRNTAYQRFLPSGPLALLPLPDARSSIVWSVGAQQARELQALDAHEFGVAVTAASGGVLGRCELAGAVASYPLKLQSAVDYVRRRAVLVGDAAHVVHPLAGQGLNLGLLDCAALCEVLGGTRAQTGVTARGTGASTAGVDDAFGDHRALRRYERWRRSENQLTSAALDGLQRLFSSSNPALSTLRRAGLGMVNRMPALKRELARRALGLEGDLPALVER